MKCKPYSEITVESRTQLKTVKITSNIFAVYSQLRYLCSYTILDSVKKNKLSYFFLVKLFFLQKIKRLIFFLFILLLIQPLILMKILLSFLLGYTYYISVVLKYDFRIGFKKNLNQAIWCYATIFGNTMIA